jgi:tetratricopeptide (TPR) repeat protein
MLSPKRSTISNPNSNVQSKPQTVFGKILSYFKRPTEELPIEPPAKSVNRSIQPIQTDIDSFIALNQEEFQFLLAFVGMSKEFKFAFAEINFSPDNDNLIAALAAQPSCQQIQFAVINVDDPDLHFLLSELTIKVAEIERELDKKLVLIIRGLEKSIRTTGEYPNVLANLNYARDSFTVAIPHPIIFLLPDYAVTRFALFAPDFWAWTAATFKFKTTLVVLDHAIEQSRIDPGITRTYAKPERSDRIDLLERLLQEYPEGTEASSRARLEVLNQLGTAHQSTRDFETATIYFEQALELSHEIKYQRGEASAFYNLGAIAYDLRRFDEAGELFKQSLILKEKIGNRRSTGNNYHFLGSVAQALREWEEARSNYRQALAISEEFNDRYSQAGTYHQLGRVAQELREWEEARTNYRQALAIKAEFNDRYSQASTYHQLGIVAQELREWEEARSNYRQALAISEEFNDRYSQASTYHQLGRVAQQLREWEEARSNYRQALAIFAEFNDRYEQAGTYNNLGAVAQELREWEEARSNYRQALAIYEGFSDRYSQASTYNQLGLLAAFEGKLAEATKNLEQALEIFTEFKDEHSMGIATRNLARIASAQQESTSSTVAK